MDKRETSGILAGIASSFIGGMATAVTRYAVADMDAVVVTLFRFGIAGLLLLSVALALRKPWPRGRDALPAAALGILFYGGFFVVFAHALTYTTAARGALAIATLPAMTLLIAAALGREAVTPSKAVGVLVAFAGVALSLYAGLGAAPAQAWKGDLMMLAAMSSMALYTILSRPLIGRSSALGYACFGMLAGALFMGSVVVGTSGLDFMRGLQGRQWVAMLFLGVLPGAVGFFLWVFAAERTSPTRATVTITVNPVSAAALAAVLVAEPFMPTLLLGAAAVGVGIWIAASEKKTIKKDSC